MCKFSGKIMMLAATALFLSVGTVVAGQSSGDWNNSWGFPGTFEKSRLVEQALAIELIEEDGFNNTSTYFGTNDTYIGGNFPIGELSDLGEKDRVYGGASVSVSF
jgi:hypothetical protein